MKLAHILVCHTTDPTKAIESIPHCEEAIWYVYLHSEDAVLEKRVVALMDNRGGNIFDYKTNRGLARSWNDGLHLAMQANVDATLLLNDDLFFYDGGYAAFVHTIKALKEISRNVAYATPLGLETGTSAHAGQVQPQHFACCAIMPEMVERVGYLDETFSPAYYEDVDYDRRARLAGMDVHVHQAVIVEHERSGTSRSMTSSDKLIAEQQYACNRNYFIRKWGGDNPLYLTPFNDSSQNQKISYASRHLPYACR